MHKLKILICTLSLFTLSACQNVQKNNKIIAKAFDTSTHFQRYLMDKHAPENVIVTHNITYQEQPKLSLDLYQPIDIQQFEKTPNSDLDSWWWLDFRC